MTKIQLRCPTKPDIPLHSTKLSPGDGFYKYINEEWLSSTKIPSWRSELSVSDEIEKLTDHQLLKIIQDLPSTKSNELLLALQQTWHSRKSETEEAYLEIHLREILSATDRKSQARILGQFCRYRISTALILIGEEETIEPYFVRTSFIPGNLTLPLKYYLDPSLQTGDLWESYKAFIGKAALELSSPVLLHTIYAELSLAKAIDNSYSTIIKRVKGNKFDIEFEWDSFMEGWGLDSSWKTRHWLFNSYKEIQGILHWFSNAPFEQVAALLSFHLITFASPYLRKSIKDASNRLFHKSLRGIEKEPSDSEQFLNDLKNIVPDALCQVYSYEQQKYKSLKEVHILLETIRESAIRLMDTTTIFRSKTKSAAKEKIRRMLFEIGNGGISELPKIDLTTKSLVQLLLMIQEWHSLELYSLIGKPAYTSKISAYPCFNANASYYSESNHIIIPWGIIQWPFYCDAAPLGWNYGGLGATIGHELTHGFDLEGSQYNPKAVYKEWWTRRNRNQFKKRTRKVVQSFETIQHYGIHINGKRTLSENWADLGGLLISLNALKYRLNTLKINESQIKEAYRNFFTAYAVSWRTLVRKKQMIYSLHTSVHSPSEDRVDMIVSQFQEWIDAFDIQKTDPLYIPPGKRLKFF